MDYIIRTPTDMGHALRAVRRRLQRLQQDAAARATISRQHLSEIENGKAPNIELTTLLRLLSSYGMVLKIDAEGPRPNLNDILMARDKGDDLFE